MNQFLHQVRRSVGKHFGEHVLINDTVLKYMEEKFVEFVDLVKRFSKDYLVAKIAFDTAKNRAFKF